MRQGTEPAFLPRAGNRLQVISEAAAAERQHGPDARPKKPLMQPSLRPPRGGSTTIKLSDCCVRATLDVIQGKWKSVIIEALEGGSRCYGELRRILPESTKKVLTAQLRELETDGIVSRKVKMERVIRVEYSITKHGWTLIPVLALMGAWGQKHKITKKIAGVALFPANATSREAPLTPALWE